MRSFQSLLPSQTLPLFTAYFFPLIITPRFLLLPDLTARHIARKCHALGRDSSWLVHYSDQLMPALGLPSGVTRCLCQAFCCTISVSVCSIFPWIPLALFPEHHLQFQFSLGPDPPAPHCPSEPDSFDCSGTV